MDPAKCMLRGGLQGLVLKTDSRRCRAPAVIACNSRAPGRPYNPNHSSRVTLRQRTTPRCQATPLPRLSLEGGDGPAALAGVEQPSTSDACSATALPPGSADSDGAASSTSSSSEVESGDGTIKIDLQHPRRSLQVTFTCNACNARTERLVNPVAWHKGLVIAQCAGCQVWHKLADAANLVDEIRYADPPNSDEE